VGVVWVCGCVASECGCGVGVWLWFFRLTSGKFTYEYSPEARALAQAGNIPVCKFS
jgi:hypothetical protein